MTTPDRYAAILNTLIEIAKERGLSNPGSEEAIICYDLLESAISEADVWGVSLIDIGLDKFNTTQLLTTRDDKLSLSKNAE